MAIRYHHTQSGTLMLTVLPVAALFCAGLGLLDPAQRMPLWGLAVALGILAWLFSSLTVEVTDAEVQWHFGPGLWRYRVVLDDINGVKIVHNQWWNGFGIRRGSGLRLYNVSGLDAVELVLKSGDRRRIGSDDVEALGTALNAMIDGDRRAS